MSVNVPTRLRLSEEALERKILSTVFIIGVEVGVFLTILFYFCTSTP